MRPCDECGQLKPLSEFYANGLVQGPGRKRMCKLCYKAQYDGGGESGNGKKKRALVKQEKATAARKDRATADREQKRTDMQRRLLDLGLTQ